MFGSASISMVCLGSTRSFRICPDDRSLKRAFCVLRLSFLEVWERAAILGKDVQSAYWKEFVPFGLGADFRFVNEVARQLLDYGRPGTATDMLAMYAERTDPPAKPELIADVLEALVGSEADEQRLVTPYELQRLARGTSEPPALTRTGW